jgi:RNA polymerase I-specific transcription-initiation factor
MLSLHPEASTSAVEQICHRLEEKRLMIRPLHIISPDADQDPEVDPGGIATIYNDLVAKIPMHGLSTTEISSQAHTIKEIAVDVGLANIGVLRGTVLHTSFPTLGKYTDVDPSVKMSKAATTLLGNWGQEPQVEQPVMIVLPKKRKRVKTNVRNEVAEITTSQRDGHGVPGTMSSQVTNDGVGITMSQPEKGRYGMRKLRKKPRRSGF